jgi:DNA-binding NtrC family response regulator
MTVEKQETASLVNHALMLYIGNWRKQILIYSITFVAVLLISLAADASGEGIGFIVFLAVTLTAALLVLLPLLIARQERYSSRPGNISTAAERLKSNESQPPIHEEKNLDEHSVETTAIDNITLSPLVIGRSPAMTKLFSVIERVAPTDAAVMIMGATGTGKELIARIIHELSPRRDGAFVDINCSAIPETLIESELFGYQRGSFAGAHENRLGLFEKAAGGTLFLDEVEALNLSVQAKLLRVLQERTVRRLGARGHIAIDVRIISATNCDLAQAVAEGRFRPDLYYRLRVLPLHVPELSTRGDDVRLLVDHFLRVKSEKTGQPLRKFTAEAMSALCAYPWPGNVRELENTIEYALAIGVENELGVADLPPEILSAVRQENPEDIFRQMLAAYMDDTVPLAEIEKRYILSALNHFGGNQARTAAALGIDRSKLYRRLKQYGGSGLAHSRESGEANPERALFRQFRRPDSQ